MKNEKDLFKQEDFTKEEIELALQKLNAWLDREKDEYTELAWEQVRGSRLNLYPPYERLIAAGVELPKETKIREEMKKNNAGWGHNTLGPESKWFKK